MSKNKHYVIDAELWKEIRVSQGRGKRTKRLEFLLILIARNIMRVNQHRTPRQDQEDIINESIMFVLVQYKSFRGDKYDTALPYITEIIKRAQTFAFNKITRNQSNAYSDIPVFYNIDDMLGYDNYNKRNKS